MIHFPTQNIENKTIASNISFKKEKVVMIANIYFFVFLFSSFIFISWRLITLQYCSGFCHTLTWISHGFTCIPHPDPPYTSLSTRSLWVFPVHQPQALVSCVQPGLDSQHLSVMRQSIYTVMYSKPSHASLDVLLMRATQSNYNFFFFFLPLRWEKA